LWKKSEQSCGNSGKKLGVQGGEACKRENQVQTLPERILRGVHQRKEIRDFSREKGEFGKRSEHDWGGFRMPKRKRGGKET